MIVFIFDNFLQNIKGTESKCRQLFTFEENIYFERNYEHSKSTCQANHRA